MKKLLLTTIAIITIPLTSFAYTGTWGFLSTSTPNYYPLSVNGIMPGVWADHFVATSTTATSTFLTKVMIGNALNGGMLAPVGFTGIPYITPSLQTSFNPDSVTGGAGQLAGGYTLANTGVGAYDAVPIVFNNASSTFVGTNSVDYAAIAFTGPNFSAYPGLPANSLGLQVSDGAMIFDVSTSTASKAYMAWGIGPGYTSANYDMALRGIAGVTTLSASSSDTGLGIGSSTPTAKLSIEASTTAAYPYLAITGLNTVSGARTSVFQINNNGNVGIGTASPTTTLEVNGSITMSAGANRTIAVSNATTSVNGYNLSLLSANGGNSTTGNSYGGGALNITTGNGGITTGATGYGGGSSGGTLNITTGTGSSYTGDGATVAQGGPGGVFNITTGQGAFGSTQLGASGQITVNTGAGISGVGLNLNGGDSGSITYTPGIGGTGAVGKVGGTGGSFFFNSGAGGVNTTASTTATNTGGNGGSMSVGGGAGGQASLGSTNVGGNAGAFSFYGGTGGQAGSNTVTGTSTGGNGSAVAFYGGSGGTVLNKNTNDTPSTGGKGGSLSFSGGNGAFAQKGSIVTGGVAGALNFTGGNGGNATNGAINIAQNGGDMNFTGGAGGSGSNTNGGSMYFLGGAKNASGLDGNILLGINAAGTVRGNIGIGTSTPGSKLTVKGHIGTDGAIPTLSSAGTSPSIDTGSTDTAGRISEGTIATGATITFASAYARAPFCTLSSEAGLLFSYTVSSTTIAITNIGALSSTAVDYHCISNDL